jgi:hypothetical protein
VLKSKYVLACLTWLLQCLLGTVCAVNPDITFCTTKSQVNATAPGRTPPQKIKLTPRGPKKVSPEQTRPLEASRKSLTLLKNTGLAHPLSYYDIQEPDPTASEESLQSIIQYDAEDAIIFNVKHQTIRLYGAGIIKHDTIKLEAEEVFLDWINHTIAAFSKKNEAGIKEKKAVLTKDGVEYIAENVRYNFASQRATANKLFSKQEDGIFKANKIKKDEETTFYADDVTYTTCNLTKPHFHVHARQVKITQDDQVVSGPFKLYFDGVPTPLGLPFGIFYLPRGSGIIPPRYGGESEKGFCFKNGGYYIKFNDYVDLALQGSIYSKGSTEFTAKSNYKKRYRYSGNLYFERNIHLAPEETSPFKKNTTWCFRWHHKTDTNKYSSLYVQIDLKKRSINTNHALLGMGIGSLQTPKSSSIRYTNHLIGCPLPYTLGSSLRFQTLQSGVAHASLPEVSLSTTNMYPFRKRGAIGTSWYSNIYLQHKFEYKNELSCSPKDRLDFLAPKDWKAIWKQKKCGTRHTVSLQTNIKILRYLNITPKIEYQERWYWESIDYGYDARGAITKEKVPGFVRVYDCNFGAGLRTTVYGTYVFGHRAAVQAVRHQINPELAFTYTPDFSDPKYGYWQTMKGGKQDGEKFNRFEEAALYPSPGKKATAVLALSLKNGLYAKVRSKTNNKEKAKKVSILESFDWSTSYDFLADQHALGDIQLQTRTSLFDKLFDINFGVTFDPYLYKGTKRPHQHSKKELTRSNELAWKHRKGLGRIKNAQLSISAKLGPRSKNHALSDKKNDSKAEKNTQENTTQYVKFKLPCHLNLNYKWNYSCPKPGETPEKVNSLGFEWRMELTEKWQVTCKSAYDITKREFVGNVTDIGIRRDLHCWEMDFNWNPLGEKQTYKFSLGLKAPLLKDWDYSRENKYTKY